MISDDYAVYLPAVNTLYAGILTKPIEENRPFPSTFTLDDMLFWRGNNKLFYHPHFLHSVGHYKVGSRADNVITRRGRKDGFLFGDSGGYQIGTGNMDGVKGLKGAMPADDACYAWREAYDVRSWIVGWLETYTNYAMTIDMPLWARDPSKANTPFHQCTPDQLIQLTVENLKFIDVHRQDKTKWLNVIQGADINALTKWWNAVKWFKCSGYALSSSANLNIILEPLLMMRDENALDAGHDWIHVLGLSTAPWAVMLTAIQKALRANVNPNLRVSYDSSSPFLTIGKWEEYSIVPKLGKNIKDWAIKKAKVPHSLKHVGSQAPLPFSSPIADKLNLGHLNVRYDKYDPTQIETLSRAFVANHNVWTYLETFKQANELAFETERSEIPDNMKDCVDFIENIFTIDNWKSELVQNEKLLKSFKS